MSDNTTAKLVDIVNQSSDSLVNALQLYWPSLGGNEMAERNLSLHLGSEFMNANYTTFAEVTFPDYPNQHIDLLAIDFESQVVVAVECKRIYDSEKAQAIRNDINRIMSFRLSKTGVKGKLNSYAFYGIVIASTWSPHITDWWASDLTSTPKGFTKTEPWVELRNIFLDSATTKHRDTIHLNHMHANWDKDHSLLFAVLDCGQVEL